MDSGAPELSEGAYHGLVGSASCCAWAGAGIRSGLWRWDFSLSNRKPVIQHAQFHHQTVQQPLDVQEFFLVRYYHWFSQWYPLTFSLLNAHRICLLRIDWTGNSFSGLNLSDLCVWHCPVLLLLIKNLWLLCYKYVSWIQGFILPTDTLNKYKNKSDFWM